MRLVMPPVLFFTLELPFTTLAHLILPRPVANGVISGAFTAYVCYDCLHYLSVFLLLLFAIQELTALVLDLQLPPYQASSSFPGSKVVPHALILFLDVLT